MEAPSKSKWTKHLCLAEDRRLSRLLPETRLFSRDALWQMVDSFGQVVLKPLFGARGKGIVVVSRLADGRYELHVKNKRRRFQGKRATFARIKRRVRSRPYLVQRFIPLAQAGGVPFDLRVMVQRGRRGKWVVTGRLAKIASRGYAVTNPEEKVVPAEEALQQANLLRSPRRILSRVDRALLHAARRLDGWYPRLSIIGFDVGLDDDGRVWIIEANFRPAIYWFKHLPDRSAYETIREYRRARSSAGSV